MPITTNPDRLQYWQDSIARAKKEKVRVWHTKKMGWRAHSANSKEIYILKTFSVENNQTGISCSCPGYNYRNYCKHLAALALKLGKTENIRLM